MDVGIVRKCHRRIIEAGYINVSIFRPVSWIRESTNTIYGRASSHGLDGRFEFSLKGGGKFARKLGKKLGHGDARRRSERGGRGDQSRAIILLSGSVITAVVVDDDGGGGSAFGHGVGGGLIIGVGSTAEVVIGSTWTQEAVVRPCSGI